MAIKTLETLSRHKIINITMDVYRSLQSKALTLDGTTLGATTLKGSYLDTERYSNL